MNRQPRLFRLVRLLQGAMAVLCIVLVGVLGVAGLDAEFHAHLHGHALHHHDHDHAHQGHGHGHHHHHHDDETSEHPDGLCVIDLFAHGLTSVVAQPVVVAPTKLGESIYQTAAESAVPTKPAGLLPPGCGPPLV